MYSLLIYWITNTDSSTTHKLVYVCEPTNKSMNSGIPALHNIMSKKKKSRYGNLDENLKVFIKTIINFLKQIA